MIILGGLFAGILIVAVLYLFSWDQVQENILGASPLIVILITLLAYAGWVWEWPHRLPCTECKRVYYWESHKLKTPLDICITKQQPCRWSLSPTETVTIRSIE
jgi:hypothetical protein